jgi:hypothetical protein
MTRRTLKDYGPGKKLIASAIKQRIQIDPAECFNSYGPAEKIFMREALNDPPVLKEALRFYWRCHCGDVANEMEVESV